MPRRKRDYTEVVLAYLTGNGKYVPKQKISKDLNISSHALNKAITNLRRNGKIGRICSYPKVIDKDLYSSRRAHIYYGVK